MVTKNKTEKWIDLFETLAKKHCEILLENDKEMGYAFWLYFANHDVCPIGFRSLGALTADLTGIGCYLDYYCANVAYSSSPDEFLAMEKELREALKLEGIL